MHDYHIVFKEEGIDQAAKQFLSLTGNHKHLAFYGEMGAGKTTFIKTLCHMIGTHDLVSSPTFAIINEYTLGEDQCIYHFDFYRIKTPRELLDIGFHDYCSSENHCFIEWPEKAPEIIPDDFINVNLTVLEDGSRKLSFIL